MKEKQFKIVAYPSPSGARQYRLDQIAKYINLNDKSSVMVISSAPMHDQALEATDVIVLQQTVDPKKIAHAMAWAGEYGKLLVYELDDFMDVPPEHLLYNEHVQLDASVWTRAGVSKVDIVTTTTDVLAEEIKKYNKNVYVLKNCLDMDLWGYSPLSQTVGGEIRVGWAGSATHREDMKMLKPAVMELLNKYPNVKFFYCGDGELWKSKLFEGHPRTEYVEPTSIDNWPAKLRSLRFDIGLIPLLDTPFNRSKSNLKYLEYGAYKIPAVMSPVVYSATVKDGVTGLFAETPKDFFKQASRLIDNVSLRKRIGEATYKDVHDNYDIRNHWKEWLNVYKNEFRKKQRRNK